MSVRSSALAASRTANAMLAAGREAEAHRWFQRALEIDPGDGNAAAGVITKLLKQHDLVGAVGILQTALQHAPFDLRLADLRREVALALYAENHWEDAAPLLAEASLLEPWDRTLARTAARVRRPAYVAQTIVDPLSGRTLERYAARESETYIFVIEIVGTCNLRCPTCPVGNTPDSGRPNGLMTAALFEQIVARIKRESPVPDPHINLYNWGEPLLHPQLPEFIQLLKKEDLRVHLSSNLNIKRGLEGVVAADPDTLKISLSGFSPETYRLPHARGDIELVKANMRSISELRRRYGTKTRIWVGHHIYKSNRHEINEVSRFCSELGFEHVPTEAFYMPLERLMDVLAGRPVPADAGIVSDLLTHPAEGRRLRAQRRRDRFDCELRFNQTVINHDGTVALCCTVYEPSNMLGVHFLDASLPDLNAMKYKHQFCGRCFASDLQYAPAELSFPVTATAST